MSSVAEDDCATSASEV